MFHLPLVLLVTLSAAPRLVADLNIEPSTSGIDGRVFGTLGNRTIFSFTTESGNEPWVADLAAGTASLLKDLNPGSASSYPYGIGVLNGRLLFVADDGIHGGELWSTDGTLAGTTLVKDVHPGSGGAVYRNATLVNGALYFFADDGVHGLELWKSDGTEAGTALVVDAKPGSTGFDSSVRGFANVGGRLYFGAFNEVWGTDGTAAGTALVYAVSQATHTRDVYPFSALGQLFFTSGYNSLYTWDLYVSDGTTAGTKLVGGVGSGGGLEGVMAGKLFYSTWSGSNGSYSISLRATDGATSTSIGSYSGSSSTSVITLGVDPAWPVGFFTVASATAPALYVTDGTAAGTKLLQSLKKGPSSVCRLGTDYLWVATDATGPALFSWDGTATAPAVVKRFTAMSISGLPPRVTGGHLFFLVDDGVSGEEMWASDGSAAGTVLLADATAGGSSYLYDAQDFGGELLFTVGPPSTYTTFQTFRSDGTAAGTKKLGDFRPPFWAITASGAMTVGLEPPSATLRLLPAGGGAPVSKAIWTLPPASSDPENFTAGPGGAAYFSARPTGQSYPTTLFRSDGTANGTQSLINVFGQALSKFGMVGSTLVFFSGGGVWGSDGTASNSYSVAGGTDMTILGSRVIFGRSRSGGGYELASSTGARQSSSSLVYVPSYPWQFFSAGPYAYFQQSAPSYGYYLYRTDGTASSTGTLKVATTIMSQPTAFGTKVGFVANDTELWETDGTTANTAVVPGTQMTDPDDLHGAAGVLFFTAKEAATGREVWALDANGARRLADFEPGPGDSKLLDATPQGTGAVLLVQNGARRFLVRTDGTPAGTTVLGDAPGATWLRTSSDVVYLSCATAAEGLELCALGPNATTPTLLGDLNPGPQPSSPGPVARVGTQLWFTAYTPATGREPFVLDLAPDTTPPVITPLVTGTQGKNGFYTSNVTVSFQVSDPESPATPSAGCATTTVTSDTAGKTFTCTATSAGGNATGSVTVKRDATKPTLTCPGPRTVAAYQPVSYGASAFDAIDPIPTVVLAPPSGTSFPPGVTSVMAVATDRAGNEASCSFDVTALAPDAGTVAPDASTPPRPDAGAAPDASTAKADAGSPQVPPDAGTALPADASSEDELPPDPAAQSTGCGCTSSGVAGIDLGGALLALAFLRRRRR